SLAGAGAGQRARVVVAALVPFRLQHLVSAVVSVLATSAGGAPALAWSRASRGLLAMLHRDAGLLRGLVIPSATAWLGCRERPLERTALCADLYAAAAGAWRRHACAWAVGTPGGAPSDAAQPAARNVISGMPALRPHAPDSKLQDACSL